MPSLSRPEAPLSWIPLVEPDQAPAPLGALYERIRTHSSRGRVANLWRAMGQHPASLAAAFDHYRALMDDPAPLTKAQAELLALVVSATNGCSYCVAHHGPRLLTRHGMTTLPTWHPQRPLPGLGDPQGIHIPGSGWARYLLARPRHRLELP